jgi:hypothetical protein
LPLQPLLLQLPHLVGAFAEPHEEIVWLDVPVNEAARVHILHASNLQQQSAHNIMLALVSQRSMLAHY